VTSDRGSLRCLAQGERRPRRDPRLGLRPRYRFARDTLGYAHDEAAAYANVRSVEELNRQMLHLHAA
jgi:hypothetical protein